MFENELKKMLSDTFSLPLVLFGDTFVTPPLECHVLFEWPLIFFDSFFIILFFENNTGHTNTSDGPLAVCLFDTPDLDRKASIWECGREKNRFCASSQSFQVH